MSIRIMHVVDTWAVGGLQNGLTNLIERMDRSQFENIVCALRPVESTNAQRIPGGGTQLICLSREESRQRMQVGVLAQKIRVLKPDVVHTRNWGTFEALLAARWVGGCALVHSEHGIDWDTTSKEPLRRLLYRRMAFQLADQAFSVSSQLRDLHAQRTGFSARKIKVIHNGVDSRRFSPDPALRDRIRRQLGVADDEFCIGSVGNLIPVKDHFTLLRAAERFSQGGRRWRLLIAGAGSEVAKLTAFVDAHPEMKRCVLFLGRSNSIPELLNGMDAYVLSSLTEGISNSLLEAMATGLPVVATATGGNPEVVVEGVSGLLFPVGDDRRLCEHLMALDTQIELRHRLGERALTRVREEFSIDSMVAKYQEVYQGLESMSAAPLSAVTGG